MANDNAITRLLFAILSQKCLKDVDWNRVAANPILRQEITNGHAARMRYSRFKKQMEGTISSSSTSSSSSAVPRRARVQKATRDTKGKGKIKERRGSEPEVGESSSSGGGGGGAQIKSEPGTISLNPPQDQTHSPSLSSPGTAHSGSLFERSMTAGTSTPERNMLPPGGAQSFTSSFVKSEYGMDMSADPGSEPQTPGLASHSQCVGHDHTPAGSFGPGMGGMGMEMSGEDVMMGSFGSGGLFGEVGVGMGGMGHHPHHGNQRQHQHQHPHLHHQSFHHPSFRSQQQHAHQHHHPSCHPHHTHLPHTHHTQSFPPMSSMSMAPMHMNMTSTSLLTPGINTDMGMESGVHDYDHLWTASPAAGSVQAQSQAQAQRERQGQGQLSPQQGQVQRAIQACVGVSSANGNVEIDGEDVGIVGVKKEPPWEEDYVQA